MFGYVCHVFRPRLVKSTLAVVVVGVLLAVVIQAGSSATAPETGGTPVGQVSTVDAARSGPGPSLPQSGTRRGMGPASPAGPPLGAVALVSSLDAKVPPPTPEHHYREYFKKYFDEEMAKHAHKHSAVPVPVPPPAPVPVEHKYKYEYEYEFEFEYEYEYEYEVEKPKYDEPKYDDKYDDKPKYDDKSGKGGGKYEGKYDDD
jgi:hypothetical protein